MDEAQLEEDRPARAARAAARRDEQPAAATRDAGRIATGAGRLVFDRAALVLTVLLGMVGLVYLWTPTDVDLWWHLRNGRLVVEAGVPAAEVYSFTAPGSLWILQSWLTDVLMHAVMSTAGYGLLLALFAAVSVVTYLVLYRVLRAVGAGPALATGLLVVRVLIDAPAWGVRPQMLTHLYFTIFLGILLAYRATAASATDKGRIDGPAAWIGPDRRLWLLPPLMLAWANTHAGFAVGFMLLGLWIVGEAANALLGRRPATPLRPLVAVSAAGVLASLANPYGPMLWLYPLLYLGGPGNNTMVRYIQEWQPIDARSVQHAPFVLTLLVVLALALLRPDGRRDDTEQRPAAGRQHLRALPFRGDMTLLFAAGLFLVMAMQAMRLQPQWASIWAVVVAMAAPRLWPPLGRDRGHDTPAWRSRLNLALAGGTLAVVALLLIASPRAQLGPTPHTAGFPAEVVDYLAAHPELGADPLYNDWDWGGYLIYRRWPEHRVFIDPRADPYRGEVMNDYVSTLGGGPAWRDVFTKYGVRGALVNRASALAQALGDSAGWRQVCCASGPALLFVRQ